MIKYRDNRTALTVKLLTGETLEGAIRWYDDHAIRLVQADRTEVTVYFAGDCVLQDPRLSADTINRKSPPAFDNKGGLLLCVTLEAPSGIEPLHKGFADLSLTTWARRRRT